MTTPLPLPHSRYTTTNTPIPMCTTPTTVATATGTSTATAAAASPIPNPPHHESSTTTTAVSTTTTPSWIVILLAILGRLQSSSHLPGLPRHTISELFLQPMGLVVLKCVLSDRGELSLCSFVLGCPWMHRALEMKAKFESADGMEASQWASMDAWPNHSHDRCQLCS